jgi:predicted ATP-grasp superfamily ATP-dependent carboligase
MTINLEKNTTNGFALTLRELGVLGNPYYLFVFQHELEETTKAVVLENIAGAYSRCEEFELTLPEDLNLTTEGNYFVTVYEQTSAVNTNPDMAGGLVHFGKCKLLLSAQTEYYHNPTTTE